MWHINRSCLSPMFLSGTMFTNWCKNKCFGFKKAANLGTKLEVVKKRLHLIIQKKTFAFNLAFLSILTWNIINRCSGRPVIVEEMIINSPS